MSGVGEASSDCAVCLSAPVSDRDVELAAASIKVDCRDVEESECDSDCACCSAGLDACATAMLLVEGCGSDEACLRAFVGSRVTTSGELGVGKLMSSNVSSGYDMPVIGGACECDD